jgi:hypothetical protein
MNDTPQYTAVVVNAYGVLPNRTVLTHYSLTSTYQTAGWQKSAALDVATHFPNWGRRVNLVEIYAQTADGRDWPFCLDDLRLRFAPAGGKKGNKGKGKRVEERGQEVVEMHVEMDVH